MQMMIRWQKTWPAYVGTPNKGQTVARGQGARHDGARDRGEYFGSIGFLVGWFLAKLWPKEAKGDDAVR